MNKEISNIDEDNFSLDEIINKIRLWTTYILKKWWIILIISVIGGLLGYLYAAKQPITYNAKLTFVVEEGKSGGGGGLASLAGQFGFDFSGGAAGNSLFSGDNILLFLKSPRLIKETLLTPYDSAKNYSLADKYADAYKLRPGWLSGKKISNSDLYFPSTTTKPLTRVQDSLLQGIINNIALNELFIERPEKKATFLLVQTVMQDELLSKFFCERLVNQATDRYIQSKTKRQKTNVDRLQRRADSIGALLNNRTYTNAVDNEKLLDINPAYKSSGVTAEVSGRDKLMLATIYAEVVKNLELSKFSLSQETPTIQVVDGVELPLVKKKMSKLTVAIIFSIILGFMPVLFFTIKHLLTNFLLSTKKSVKV